MVVIVVKRIAQRRKVKSKGNCTEDKKKEKVYLSPAEDKSLFLDGLDGLSRLDGLLSILFSHVTRGCEPPPGPI